MTKNKSSSVSGSQIFSSAMRGSRLSSAEANQTITVSANRAFSGVGGSPRPRSSRSSSHRLISAVVNR